MSLPKRDPATPVHRPRVPVAEVPTSIPRATAKDRGAGHDEIGDPAGRTRRSVGHPKKPECRAAAARRRVSVHHRRRPEEHPARADDDVAGVDGVEVGKDSRDGGEAVPAG